MNLVSDNLTIKYSNKELLDIFNEWLEESENLDIYLLKQKLKITKIQNKILFYTMADNADEYLCEIFINYLKIMIRESLLKDYGSIEKIMKMDLEEILKQKKYNFVYDKMIATTGKITNKYINKYPCTKKISVLLGIKSFAIIPLEYIKAFFPTCIEEDEYIIKIFMYSYEKDIKMSEKYFCGCSKQSDGQSDVDNFYYVLMHLCKINNIDVDNELDAIKKLNAEFLQKYNLTRQYGLIEIFTLFLGYTEEEFYHYKKVLKTNGFC